MEYYPRCWSFGKGIVLVSEGFSTVTFTGIKNLPEVKPGDDIASLILASVEKLELSFREGDIFVIAHKIISKSEGRLIKLSEVTPSPRAQNLATRLNKDPRKVEVILSESKSIVRERFIPGRSEGVLICEHRLGFICANAGVDESNVPGGETLLLLPKDPDRTARRIREAIENRSRTLAGVIISDTFGRPFRWGILNVAIATAGVPPLLDPRGTPDDFGRTLKGTTIPFADEVAAAAGLVMGKTRRTPVVLGRGLCWTESNAPVSILFRKREEDLFR